MSKPCPKTVKKFFLFAFIGVLALIVVWRTVDKRLVYRTPYYDDVAAAAADVGVDIWLIYAVMKAESGFRADAVSGKGAVGLMQILPSTAQFVASANQKTYDGESLSVPSVNIWYGAWYLGYLLQKFALKEAIAAYNAGEGRVSAWLKNPNYSADGTTLSVIPYRETGAYVRRVLKNISKYKKYHG